MNFGGIGEGRVSKRHTFWREGLTGARALFFLCLAGVLSASAQQPGSIVSFPIPDADGASVFDSDGNVYITGASGPRTPGSAQPEPGGGTCFALGIGPGGSRQFPCTDAHVTKVSAHGQIVFGTGLGGSMMDFGRAIAVDRSGNIYVAGSSGGDFPTTANAASPQSTGLAGFAAKLTPDGSRVMYATYLPAASPTAIAVDSHGNLAIVNQTGEVIKLSADGSAFLYTLRFPGLATSVAIDDHDNVIVAGYTAAADFPSTGGTLQSRLSGESDVFLVKLDPGGQIVFSTLLGGSREERYASVKLDSAGNIYVAGGTDSLDFPTTQGTFRPQPLVPLWARSPGGFLAKLTPDARTLIYGTYVPMVVPTGALPTHVLSVTPSGEAYLAGFTRASFPVTPSAPRPCYLPDGDVFVAHFSPHGDLRDATYHGTLSSDMLTGISAGDDGPVLLAFAGQDRGFSRIQFGTGDWRPASCISQRLLHAAKRAGDGAVVPGQFAILTGFGIGPEQGVAYSPDPPNPIPQLLGGVRVYFDGLSAPVLYAQSSQVNVQVPYELQGRETTTVTLEYNGTPFAPITASIRATEPAYFRIQPDVSTQALAMHLDGSFNAPSHPADRGSVIALWGTGFRPLDAPCPTGGWNPGAASSLPPNAYVPLFANGGDPYTILYAGAAPGLPCGVVQINVRIPENAPSGEILLRSGGGDAGATIHVR